LSASEGGQLRGYWLGWQRDQTQPVQGADERLVRVDVDGVRPVVVGHLDPRSSSWARRTTSSARRRRWTGLVSRSAVSYSGSSRMAATGPSKSSPRRPGRRRRRAGRAGPAVLAWDCRARWIVARFSASVRPVAGRAQARWGRWLWAARLSSKVVAWERGSPLLVVSHLARRNYVDHSITDRSSIMAPSGRALSVGPVA
jgi:hypothetical protein